MTRVSPGWQAGLRQRLVPALRLAVVVAMAAVFLFYAFTSIHWAIQSDSAVIHYVRLLLDRGFQPYSQITDGNMPGTYLTEGWAMRVFGYSDVGWRLYDFLLVGVMTASMIVIAKPYDWVAGVYAAGLFTAMHGAEGPMFSVEREQVILVLLMVACAALFTAVRRRVPILAGVGGFAAGVGASIKPQFGLLALLLVALMALALRRRKVAPLRYVLWALGGIAAVVAINVWFLLSHHALGSFLYMMRVVLPSYVGTSRPSFATMLHLLTIRSVLLLTLVAVGLAVAAWRTRDKLAWERWNWERWALMLGAAYGLFSFFLQGKGYVHHRYMFLAFLLFLLGLEFMTALRHPGWRRAVAALAVVASLCLLPRAVVGMHRDAPTNPFAVQLEKDLTALGGTRQLQGRVQCFDITDGCLEALYHLRLQGNTEFTGDLTLFFATSGAALNYPRGEFWKYARADPADVIVLSNQWYERPNSFAKIDVWPEFVRYLAANYTQVAARSFDDGKMVPLGPQAESGGPEAYRLYIRNGSDLLAKAAQAGMR